MKQRHVTKKRTIFYIIGLFLLSLGISFSIYANLGVSPASSLPYALTLTTGITIGITTIFANILFIVIQVMLNRTINAKDFFLQLLVAFLFGFFMDATFYLVQFLPVANNLIIQSFYFAISLLLVPVGLVGYLLAQFPLMPYDALTYAVAERFNMAFGKAKMASDVTSVIVAAAICLIFIYSFGSIGIGTVLTALILGKNVGWLMKYFKQPLEQWIYV